MLPNIKSREKRVELDRLHKREHVRDGSKYVDYSENLKTNQSKHSDHNSHINSSSHKENKKYDEYKRKYEQILKKDDAPQI